MKIDRGLAVRGGTRTPSKPSDFRQASCIGQAQLAACLYQGTLEASFWGEVSSCFFLASFTQGSSLGVGFAPNFAARMASRRSGEF
jgi:hypothetical protein